MRKGGQMTDLDNNLLNVSLHKTAPKGKYEAFRRNIGEVMIINLPYIFDQGGSLLLYTWHIINKFYFYHR
jgi:hypothetical protein